MQRNKIGLAKTLICNEFELTYLVFSLSFIFFYNFNWETALLILEIFSRPFSKWELTVHFFVLILHHAIEVVQW